MTNQPAQATPVPQNPAQDPQVIAWREQAQADEQQAAQEAAIGHLQNRVVALNVEVRARDARIAELEQEKAALERRLNDFLVEADEPSGQDGSGDQGD